MVTYEYAFLKKAKERGLEPDECYCFGPLKKVHDIASRYFHNAMLSEGVKPPIHWDDLPLDVGDR